MNITAIPPPPRAMPLGTRLDVWTAGDTLSRAYLLVMVGNCFVATGLMQPEPAPAVVGLGALALIVGAARAVRAIADNARKLRLMEQGLVVPATLVDRMTVPAGSGTTEETLVSLEYAIEGTTHRLGVRTSDAAALIDDAVEMVLVDPSDPSSAMARDELPTWMQADEDGWLPPATSPVFLLARRFGAVTVVATLFVLAVAQASGRFAVDDGESIPHDKPGPPASSDK